MLHLAALILLTIFLNTLISKKLYRSFIAKENDCECLKQEYDKSLQENIRLKAENSDLERSAEETIALYDITKDMCKTLDEDTIFDLFKDRINRYIEVGDCRFLKAGTDVLKYKDYTVLPLTISNQNIGYLVTSDIKQKDKDKFNILAQQFLVGIKRALLYQKVQKLSITDSLTQIFSRRYFFEKFNEEIKRAKKIKHGFSFLMVDIDHFKDVNDNYGHLVGDAVLREAAKTIKETIRQIDFMGRYGGEELSIILPETDKVKALYAAERIRRAVESRQIAAYDANLKVTISIGISTFPDDARDPQILIDRADQALYLAKQTGRNRTCVYEPPN